MLVSCRRGGKRLANLSFTTLILISMSLWKWSKDKDVRRLLAIVNLRDVLIRFSLLNDLTKLQYVTARVQSVSSKTLTLGNIDEVWGNVWWSLVGSEADPCSFSWSFHFICQQWNSFKRLLWKGRSSLYKSPNCWILVETSSIFLPTKTERYKIKTL